jgi:hypothetical protein
MDSIDFPFENEMPSEAKIGLTALLNRSEFKTLRRPTWLPETSSAIDDFAASKYGGLPWLGQHEAWPICNACDRPMHFLLQLNLSQLPRQAYGDGIIQLFYCKREDCEETEKWLSSAVSLARLIEVGVPSRLVSVSEGPDDPFPVVLITKWKQQIDYFPHLSQLHTLGIELTDREHDLLADWGPLVTSDKLAGWPAWIQWPQPMQCDVCQKAMQHVYQFEPHTNLHYSFGQEYFERQVDYGCGWIFQCPQHKSHLAFTWQCQ